MAYKSFFLTKFAIKNRTAFFVAIFLMILLGIISYNALPKEDVPDIKFPYIVVTTVYPGVSPADIERLVTDPIEKQLKTLNDLKKAQSVSSESFSSIFLEFNPGVDIDSALQKVRDKVSVAKSDLPDDAKEPQVTEISFDSFPVAIISLSGHYDLEQLKNFAERIQDEVDVVPGVLDTDIVGGLEREISVLVDLFKLNHFKFSLNDIVKILSAENISIPGGTVDVGDAKYLIRVPGEFVSADELNDVVLAKKEGNLIYLRDIAKTEYGFKEQTSFARYNQKNSVSIIVTRRTGENLIALSERIHEAVAKVQVKLPNNLAVNILGDRSDSIKNMLTELLNNIFTGMLLVFGVLLFFLGKRNAIFVAIAIPLSMLISFIVIRFLGMTLNMVVLFSLILALGMLVDNGIVIVENIFRHKQKEESAIVAANTGTAEVAWPVIASTFTTIVAFVPLLFWPGIMGEFMKYLPLTLIIALLSSLFVALCISPMLSATFMSLKRDKEVLSDVVIPKHPVIHYYEKLLRSIIQNETNKPSILRRIIINTLMFVAVIVTIIGFKKFAPDYDYASNLGLIDSLIKIADKFGISIFLGLLGFGIMLTIFMRFKNNKREKIALIVLLVFLFLVLCIISIPFFDAYTGGLPISYGVVRLIFGLGLFLPILLIIDQFKFFSPATIKRHLLIHSFIIMFLASILAVPGLNVILFPRVTPQRVSIAIEMAEGTKLEKTDSVARQIENLVSMEMAKPISNIKHFQTTVGKQGGKFIASSAKSNYAEINIDFLSSDDRKKIAKKYHLDMNLLSPYLTIEKLRKKIKNIAGGKVSILEAEMGPPTGKAIYIEIAGDDLDILNMLAEKVEAIVKPIQGVINLENTFSKGTPELRVEINRTKAALLGVNTMMVASNLRTAINGTTATVFRDKDEEVDVVVKLDKSQRESYNLLRYLDIPTYQGNRVPLTQFAKLETKSSYGSVTHVDFKRVVNIQADVSKESDRTPTSIVNQIKKELKQNNIIMPRGYTLQFRGKQEEQAESSKFIGESFMIAVFLIAMVLISQFNSIILPGIILFTVALSFIGVVVGLFLSPSIFRLTFHPSAFVVIMTGVGVVSLAGVVVNNGIVLLDYIRQLRASGMEKVEAIITAGVTRFRPVMLTAVTTILGLLPMSTGISLDFTKRIFFIIPSVLINGDSSEWWAPLSDAIIFGLAVATILTLVMVPVFYFILDDIHKKIFYKLFRIRK